MKKFMKRTAAAILVMVMAITLCWTDVYATEVRAPAWGAEPESELTEEQKGTEAGDLIWQGAESTEPESAGREGSELAETVPLVNFVTIDNTYIETPGIQNIVVDTGNENTRVEFAVLQYKNQITGENLSIEAAEIYGGTLLFTIEYLAGSEAGIFQLDGISVIIEGNEYTISFTEAGLEVIYGVNMVIEAEPDDYLVDEEVLNEIEASVITLDETGTQVSETALADVLGQAGEYAPEVSATGAAGNMVIVLDPGHDATHAGATYYGYREETLALKIANYCKEELEKYSGVTLYMTRSGEACPNGGRAVSSGTCNYARVEYAKKVKADLYVSFHLNASVSSAANGVGVYYPNSNYNPGIGKEASELATKISQKLSTLGLNLWAGGKLIRNSENGTLYPDGSLADYLAVIKNCKLAGITSVLIEHAFLSNASDVANFLSSDTKLKNLGVTGAAAIAEYYGLTKGIVPPSKATLIGVTSKNSSQLSIAWNKVADATGYQLYRSEKQTGGYSKIATLKSADITTYEDKGAASGITYYYKVRAYKTADGNTAYAPYSQAVSGKTLVPPAMVKVQSQADGKLLVEWEKSNDAAGYQIQRSTAKDKGYTRIATIRSGNTTSYLDTGINTNTTYYYRVRVYNKPYGITGYSNYSGAWGGAAVSKTKVTAVQSVAGGQLSISWKKVNGASGYTVHRSTKKNGTYKKIATLKPAVTSYVDEKINIGTTYYYKVEVRNKINGVTGYSGHSNAVKGQAIGPSSITSIQSQAGGKLKITWQEVKGASGYSIARSTSKNGTYKTIATIDSGTKVTYTDKKLTAGKKYYYKIETQNLVNKKIGYSGFSEPVYGIPMAQVTVGYVKSVSAKKLKVSWEQIKGASGYQIQRSTALDGKYETIETVNSGSTTTYTDKNVKYNKKYYYKIRAIKKAKGIKGYGGYSTPIFGKAVAKTSIETIQADNSPQVSLSWKKVNGASGYVISRSTSEKGKYTKVATVKGSSTITYKDTNLEAGHTYYYKINVQNKINGKIGTSGNSSPANIFVQG